MNNETANMDQLFRQLEAGDQPDLSAMDQHWQQLKELAAVPAAPPAGSTGSSLFRPGLWIGAGLVGVAALVAVFIHQSGEVSVPSDFTAIKPVQKTTDTLPAIKPADTKIPRTGRRRATSGTASVAENTEKSLPAPSVPTTLPQANAVQDYPVKKKESSNPTLRVNGNAGKASDSIVLKPIHKRTRTTPVDILSYPVKVEPSGRVQFDTARSVIPAKPTNLVLYSLSPFQKKWLRTLPHSLTPFINP